MKDEDEDDDTKIEGYDIDCGLKDRKFLSMAKCKAVTITRHPHKRVERRDEDDDRDDFIEPYKLFENVRSSLTT